LADLAVESETTVEVVVAMEVVPVDPFVVVDDDLEVVGEPFIAKVAYRIEAEAIATMTTIMAATVIEKAPRRLLASEVT